MADQFTFDKKKGFCQCGCGGKTKIALKSDSVPGHVKGEPIRFIRGHAYKIKKHILDGIRTGTGVCECGCGNATQKSKRSSVKLRMVKGEPNRFIAGHTPKKNPLDMHKVDRKTGCWIWQGRKSKKGYGTFGPKGAYVVIYELMNGSIPKGYHVDHVCRNKMCVNPEHLEAVTPSENSRRRWSRA